MKHKQTKVLLAILYLLELYFTFVKQLIQYIIFDIPQTIDSYFHFHALLLDDHGLYYNLG